ncbi:choice-of-anchor A family protein [Streptomyces sp. NPDC051567]|uniref:choice-of-anchor A family protein n=1 Tax=Streptomyces sp. NPDC051567 TaxID=3365660 RepID=UPI0037BC5E1B
MSCTSEIPHMSISVRSSLASATIGGSLALGMLGALAAAPLAFAAPVPVPASPAATCTDALGVANLYGEFIEGDDQHTPDAEGAVAVGGNADFRGGFTVGQELTAEQVKALPGGNALVVAGDITGDVRVMKGNGIHGGTLTGLAEAHNGKVTKGPSPIDFAAEFGKLRRVSTTLAATQSATAQWRLDGTGLRLTGTDPHYNGFVIPAAELEKAKEIRIKVPVGAVTVVSVKGASYHQEKAGTTGFLLWDEAGKREVLDDKLSSAADGRIRAKLLWNFPDATTVVKKSGNAWPGSVLAPNAAFDLGAGGPVNGSVIAKSLTGKGGAETHHYPFTGCLPGTPRPANTPSPGGTVPVATPVPSVTATPSAPGASTSASASPKPVAPGASASAGPRPSGSTPAAATGGTGGSGGGLALTGAGVALPLAIGGAVVLAAGAGMVLVARRRRA